MIETWAGQLQDLIYDRVPRCVNDATLGHLYTAIWRRRYEIVLKVNVSEYPGTLLDVRDGCGVFPITKYRSSVSASLSKNGIAGKETGLMPASHQMDRRAFPNKNS